MCGGIDSSDVHVGPFMSVVWIGENLTPFYVGMIVAVPCLGFGSGSVNVISGLKV